MIKFSIITICKNAEKNIQNTMESVLKQSYSNIEYIICDSCSIDNTADTIQKTAADYAANVRLYSEKDFGVYNAMNRGIARAQGDFIIFLNAGDAFYDKNVLQKVSDCINKERHVIYYGAAQFIEFPGNRTFIQDFDKKYPRLVAGLLHGSMPCHQSIIAHRNSLRGHYFNEQYAYRSDFEWLVSCYKRGIKIKGLNFVISKYDYTGMTSRIKARNQMHNETDRILKEYFPIKYPLFQAADKIKFIFG